MPVDSAGQSDKVSPQARLLDFTARVKAAVLIVSTIDKSIIVIKLTFQRMTNACTRTCTHIFHLIATLTIET